jgi:tetratricopeptide (TPR) repeat protein
MAKEQSYQSLAKLAEELPQGDERILCREKAINLADLSGLESDMFQARYDYVNDLSSTGGYSEKYFTVFPWLLNYAEKKGTSYEKMLVLWIYKWVILEMGNHPTVTKLQIEATLEDLRKRYLAFGSNEKVYEQYAYTCYVEIHEYEKARLHYNRWRKYKKNDLLDDCEACVVNRHVSYLVKDGELKKAMKVAQPLLSGNLFCTHVPKDTWSKLLLPVYTSGDVECSAIFAEKLGKKLKTMKYNGNLDAVYALIIYHAKLGELTKAIKWLEKFMPTALEQKQLNGKFWFFTAAAYLFNHISREKIKLMLPAAFPSYNASGVYQVKDLKVWFDAEANNIAARFDKRNGNNGFATSKEKLLGF